jgi:hypothetical protein
MKNKEIPLMKKKVTYTLLGYLSSSFLEQFKGIKWFPKINDVVITIDNKNKNIKVYMVKAI